MAGAKGIHNLTLNNVHKSSITNANNITDLIGSIELRHTSSVICGTRSGRGIILHFIRDMV